MNIIQYNSTFSSFDLHYNFRLLLNNMVFLNSENVGGYDIRYTRGKYLCE